MAESTPLQTQLLARLPEHLRTAESEKRFSALGQTLDSLVYIDRHSLLHINERTCQQFLTTFLPQGADYCFQFLQEASAQRFLSDEECKALEPVGWIEAMQEVKSQLLTFGYADDISKPPTTQELFFAIQKHISSPLPPEIMDPDVFYRHLQSILKPAGEGPEIGARRKHRGAIGCLYDKLGFAGTLAVMALVAIISAFVVATIAVTGGYSATFWAAFWEFALDAGLMGAGATLLTIIVTCIVNAIVNP